MKQATNAYGEIGPYLRVANVQDGVLDLSDILEMPFQDPDHYRLGVNDILLCEGQSKELVGRAALYNGQPSPLYFQNTLIRFRSSQGIDPAYALLVFRSYQKSGIFSAIAKGTTNIAHLGRGRFSRLPFPLPPTAVQEEIALRAQGVQDSIDLIGESLEACESQLDPIVRETRDAEILGDDRLTWSGSQSGSSPWPLFPLRQVVHKDAPISYGIVQPGPEDPDGVPYIRGQDLQEGFILEDQLRKTSRDLAERYSRSSLAEGDVVLGIIRQTRVAVVPSSLTGANITQGTVRIRPSASLHPSYLAHWLSSGVAQSWLRGKMRGIDMPGLNVQDVRRLPVPVPSLEEQARIATKLDAVTERSRNLESSIASLRDNLPPLEAEILASFAYGEQAAAIGDEISGILQAAQSRELATAVAAEEVRRRAAAQAARKERQGRRVTRENDQRDHVDADRVMQALESTGSPCSPESLFAALRVDATAADSFYAALRQLRDDGKLVILRPDASKVSIALTEVR